MSTSFVGRGGLAAMVGGALWIVGTIIHVSKPRGCIVEEYAFRPMRESGALDGILTLLSLSLFAAGAAGLGVLARSTGRFGKAGTTAVILCAIGVALLVTPASYRPSSSAVISHPCRTSSSPERSPWSSGCCC